MIFEFIKITKTWQHHLFYFSIIFIYARTKLPAQVTKLSYSSNRATHQAHLSLAAWEVRPLETIYATLRAEEHPSEQLIRHNQQSNHHAMTTTTTTTTTTRPDQPRSTQTAIFRQLLLSHPGAPQPA